MAGRREWWPAGPAVGIAAGIAVLALPADVEGPALLPISAGHAVSLAAAGLTFAAGLGLGRLLASAFSAFYWWWRVGAALFVIANVAAVVVAVLGRAKAD